MSALAKVEAMRQASAAKQDERRQQVRAAMPPDMLDFVDGWKALDPDALLTFLQTPTLEAGKEGEQGLPLSKIEIGNPMKTAGGRHENKK